MILIALGANLPSAHGGPAQTLHAALRQLARNGVGVIGVSRFFVTPAWPDPADPPFVNAVARVETAQSPEALMAQLSATETDFGRTRAARNAPRSLDLDLIDYNGLIIAGDLLLPHPRAAERGFVLVPLADIVPGWIHPVSGLHVRDLIDVLPAADRAQISPIVKAV